MRWAVDRSVRPPLVAVAVAVSLALPRLRSALRAESDSFSVTRCLPSSANFTFLLPSAIELLPAFARAPTVTDALTERTLSFDEGDTVRIRVRHDDAEEVHIHGYDLKQELAPNRTATVSFKASITGIFEIELEHSGTLLAHVKVEP